MLYLNPPFHIINGVSVFGDHADPLQWYFLPLAPRLTTFDDPQSHQRIPHFELIKYTGEAGSGGFLDFDVNIGIDQKDLDDIRDEIKRLGNLKDPPRLAPVPLVGGTVKMMLFGQQSGEEPTEDEPAVPSTDPAGPKFVLKMSHNASPSLYGDNQAAFSVALDQYGATVMEQAVQGEMAPIGVIYSLEYLALRPAYTVRLHADWDRVQKHLDESFSVNTLLFSSEIDTIVDKLIEERVIVIEADTFVPEDEESSGIINRRDQALNEVRDMVTDAFFQPSLQPVKEEKDGWDKFGDLVQRSSQLSLTGGQGGLFSYRKADLTRIDRKKLNVTMSERTAVKRSIYPQGHLSGLARVLRQQGVDLSGFIIPVNIDDPWFKRRKVRVISRADFQTDQIGSLNVELQYGPDKKNVILDPSQTEATVDWASIVSGTTIERDVKTRYTVSFRGVDGTERPISLSSPEAVFDADALEIDPRTLYSIVHVPIVPIDYPWDRFPHLQVDVRYQDDANRIRIEDDFLLDQQTQPPIWGMFVLDPTRRVFDYRLTHRAADHRDVVGDWLTTEDELIPLTDPFPRKRVLEIVAPIGLFTAVDRAFVDVSYEDQANNVSREESFEFSQNDLATKAFSVELLDTAKQLVTYRVVLLFLDGHEAEIPRSSTAERRIVLRADMKGHRVVSIHPRSDLAAAHVQRIKGQIRYQDPPNLIDVRDEFTLQPDQDRARFEFDYVDESKGSYEVEVTYLYDNGLVKKILTTGDSDELVLDVT